MLLLHLPCVTSDFTLPSVSQYIIRLAYLLMRADYLTNRLIKTIYLLPTIENINCIDHFQCSINDLSAFLSLPSQMFHMQEAMFIIPYTSQCFVLFLDLVIISLYLFGKLTSIS